MMNLGQIEKQAMGIRYGERLRPARDWSVLLCVAAVLVVVSAAFNVWMYERVKSGEAFTSTTPQVTHLDTSAITNAQAIIDARAAEEANYESSYRFVDPSE